MKLIIVLIIVSFFQATAVTRAQNVSLNANSITLEEVFNSLHKQTGYNFVYNSAMLESSTPVSIAVKSKPLQDVLNECLLHQSLTYVIDDKTVIIKMKSASNNIAVTQITGSVIDEKGNTIPGVTVKIKGTSTTTSTDLNGVFHISLPTGNEVLVFSSVGYMTQEIAAGGKTTINITLLENISKLDEVVVVGYGTVKKRDLTGAVSSVKGADIASNPVSNPLEALQGRVAGLDVQRGSGQAGSSPALLVRGTRSLNATGGSSDPLYVVDGIQQSSVAALNPNDIESIDVLKDASSTAIYGSQGANGVIIVTTKKAKAGKTQIDVDSYWGINGFAKYPKPLQGDAWVQYLKDRFFAANLRQPNDFVTDLGITTAAKNAIDAGQYVDWVDETLRRGHQQNHHVAIRGGSEKVQGYLSLGFINEQGIYQGDELKAYNTRAGADVQFNKIIKAGIQSNLNWRDDNTTNSRVNKAFGVAPLGLPYNADGSVNKYPLSDGTVSPIANYAPGVYVNNSKDLYLAVTPYVELTPIKNLSIRSNFGLTLGYTRSGAFDNENSYNALAVNQTFKEATYGTNFNYNYVWENIINYKFTLNRDHSFALTGITSLLDFKNETSSIYGQGLDYDAFLYFNQGAATTTRSSTKYSGKDLTSFSGRFNYSYKGKYLLTVTDRFDGASQLVKQWSQFPSAAVAWRISDESFMTSTKNWLSNLKLRGGYGVSGNSNIPPYVSQTNVVSNSISTPVTLGGTTTLPIYILSATVANPDLTWEKSYNTNIGLDISLFNERVNIATEAYYTDTQGILYARTLPSTAGGFDAKTPYVKYQNIGTSTNRGFEATIDVRVIAKRDFKWNSTVTYTRTDEKLTSLDLGSSVNAASLISLNLFTGSPIHPTYDWKKIGVWQTDEAAEAAKYNLRPGDVKLQTNPIITNGVSDNGVHPYTANDKTIVGHPNPNWTMGWQNTFVYKSFDLNVFVNARYGQTIVAQLLGYYNGVNQPAFYNYWTPNNPTNDFPQPYQSSTSRPNNNTAFISSLPIVDGSYIKIKNITLGYTLPGKIGSKIGISKLRFYGTAYNTFIYAKSPLLKNVDPETGGSDSFPLYKQIVFGMNLSF
jgi:TonB-linked SusC/RagA family outer membrane protein